MKKLIKPFLGALLLSAVFFLTGCLADAIPDDGKGYITGINNGGSSSSGGGNWALFKDKSYDIFDLQVWGDGAGTFDYANKKDCGRFTILTKGGGWVGGGLVPGEKGKNFDFTNVKTMTFEIRGKIDANALCLAVQGNGGVTDVMYPMKFSLPTSANINQIKENDWQKVTMNVSTAAIDKIINAFCIIVAPDWGGSFNADDYFEIRNLEWLDKDDKPVTISLK